MSHVHRGIHLAGDLPITEAEAEEIKTADNLCLERIHMEELGPFTCGRAAGHQPQRHIATGLDGACYYAWEDLLP